MSSPVKLTAVMTHPIQYMALWFRHIAAHSSALDLTVVYATLPTAEQQGVGFGRPFQWDLPLTSGYRFVTVGEPRAWHDVSSERFWGLHMPEIGRAIAQTTPDVVLIPGWHSITLLRAISACRRRHVPVLYRGDTHLGNGGVGLRRSAWGAKTRWLLRRFDGFCSVGRRTAQFLGQFGIPSDRIFDVPHCVDNEFFQRSAAPHVTARGREAARAFYGLAPSDFVVLFAGKLEAKKRPWDLVRAVSRLRQCEVALLVVGSGVLEHELRAEAARLGVRAVWAGFLQPGELARAYAAADCLALPSELETWGLVVNEALAVGRPCVVSDQVGCAPDLIEPGVTGDVFPTGDVTALAAAIGRVRAMTISGHDWTASCRERVKRYSFEVATAGLVEACVAVHTRGGRPSRRLAPATSRNSMRILACCSGMVIVFGLERMTFEVLRVLAGRGSSVHCIVNSWGNCRIVSLAEEIGATWSTGYYGYKFDRHTRNPVRWAQFARDIARASTGLLREAWRVRPTHVLFPNFSAVIRNGVAVVALKAAGVPIVLRVGNCPDVRPFDRWLWSRVLPRLVTRFVPNSEFGVRRLTTLGVPPTRIVLIRNCLSRRDVLPETDAEICALTGRRRTLLCVGQIAPFKGTHLVVDATLELVRAGYDVQAVIVGSFPEWPEDRLAYFDDLRHRVASANAAERVHFVGERENVLRIMEAAFVLVAPILQEETFGNVVLEAKSVGLPVVAFPSGGLFELVEHGVTGYICREPTLAVPIEGLEYFLSDHTRRDAASKASLEAMAAPANRYACEVFEQEWSTLFDELRRGRWA